MKKNKKIVHSIGEDFRSAYNMNIVN